MRNDRYDFDAKGGILNSLDCSPGDSVVVSCGRGVAFGWFSVVYFHLTLHYSSLSLLAPLAVLQLKQ